MEENVPNRLSLGALIPLSPYERAPRFSWPVDAGLIVQLLSIRDQHPQWRNFRREDGVIAAHKYAAHPRSLSAPHEITIL